MQVHKLAKKLGMTSKQLIAEIECVDHHADKVPDDIVEKYLAKPIPEEIEPDTQTVSIQSIDPVAIEEDKCPVDMATLALSLRGAGGKSPYWKYRKLLEQ